MLCDEDACQAVGIDVDPGTVATAQSRYGGRASFMAADGTQLPFRTASFDLVTSFETLEHIAHATTFIGEVRRVLMPSGTLVLSTPNRDYTELNGHSCTNPYHVREYAPGELRKLLLPHFSSVELLGQRLSSEYRLSPFASDHQRLCVDAGAQMRLLWWRVQNKLPFALKDGLSRLFAGHSFYPGEEHYEFTETDMYMAPVLVALCHP
jgi:SAM-dependent methyltransferase